MQHDACYNETLFSNKQLRKQANQDEKMLFQPTLIL